MIKNGDNVVLKFNPDGEICRQRCKAYIYESMDYAIKYSHPNETLVEYAPVKHGNWYIADDGDGLICSECGEDFCNIYLEVERFKYCPNCGAIMGENNEK